MSLDAPNMSKIVSSLLGKKEEEAKPEPEGFAEKLHEIVAEVEGNRVTCGLQGLF